MPTVRTILFAERVVQEAGTGRYTIVGVFDTMDLNDERLASAPWYIFLSVVDLPEGTAVSLEIRIERSGSEAGEAGGFQGRGTIDVPPLNLPSPSPSPINVSFALPISLFKPAAGHYDVSVLLDGKEAATRPLFAVSEAEANGKD